MPAIDRLAAPRHSAGPVPFRLAASVRRTSSLDVTWPLGQGEAMRFLGRARDIVTAAAGADPVVVAEDGFLATVAPDWTIAAIAAEPPRDGIERLIGVHGANGFRRALREALPGEEQGATPLQLVLEDMPGATLVSSAAWEQWDPDWKRKAFGDVPIGVLLKAREGVCVGHAPGSSAQTQVDADAESARPAAAALPREDDPVGWHAMERQDGPGFRRMRRIDVRRDGPIRIDAEFQDSATTPQGGRVAIHEYGLTVTADPDTLAVLTIATDPRVLPYRECPAVSDNLPRLIGVPLPDLRKAVPAALAGAAGCTHLNDAFRALAAVPALLRHLG